MISIAKLSQLNATLFGKRLSAMFSSTLSSYQDVAFTKSHEWVEMVSAQKRVRVGITDFAQQQLG